MWQNSKTQTVIKLKKKLWQNLKDQIVTKLKNSNCTKLKKLNCDNSKTQIVIVIKMAVVTELVIMTSFITITIWVFELSQFYFLVLHHLSFWVWSQFDLSSFVTICFFEFYHSLSSWVLPQFRVFFSFVSLIFFFSFVNTRVVFLVFNNLDFLFLSQFEFSSFVAIWVFKFCHNLSFEFCHNFIF